MGLIKLQNIHFTKKKIAASEYTFRHSMMFVLSDNGTVIYTLEQDALSADVFDNFSRFDMKCVL